MAKDAYRLCYKREFLTHNGVSFAVFVYLFVCLVGCCFKATERKSKVNVAVVKFIPNLRDRRASLSPTTRIEVSHMGNARCGIVLSNLSVDIYVTA